MPKGTKIEEVYRALRDEGVSKERAAKIAQAQTGLSLATGKPPKGVENAKKVWTDPKNPKWYIIDRAVGTLTKPRKFHIIGPTGPHGEDFADLEAAKKDVARRQKSFQNGCTKAGEAIQNKMAEAGLKVENAEPRGWADITFRVDGNKTPIGIRALWKDIMKYDSSPHYAAVKYVQAKHPQWKDSISHVSVGAA